MGTAIRIIFNAFYTPYNPIFIAFKINQAVMTLMRAAPMSDGNPTAIITPTG